MHGERLDAILSAWKECRPRGMVVPLSRVEEKLPQLSLHVPGGLATPEVAHRLDVMFSATEGEASGSLVPFLQALPRYSDMVHFLHFWKAFDLAISAVLGDMHAGGTGVALEFRQFLDRALGSAVKVQQDRGHACLSEDGPESSSFPQPHVHHGKLLELLEDAKAASLLPDFWRRCKRALLDTDAGGQEAWSLEAFGAFAHDWLLLAASSGSRLPRKRPLPLSPSGPSPREAPVVMPSPGGCAPCGGPNEGIPVYLHIYDVSNEKVLRNLNRLLAHRHAPIKFGGIFHVGVEVDGVEWSYGYTTSESSTGVVGDVPRTNPDHRFRQTISLLTTQLSHEEIARLLEEMVQEYRGRDYDLLRRNCCTFADDLASRLGARRLPRWVHRLARVGARLDSILLRASGFRSRVGGEARPPVDFWARLGGA